MIYALSSTVNLSGRAAYGDAWDSIIVAIERSKATIMPNTYRHFAGRD